MKGDTYIFNGNLFLIGDINKGSFHATSEVWTQDKKLNDVFVIKGTKTNHCLHIDSTTENVQLNYDSNDFEIGTTPNFNLQLKNKVYGVKTSLYFDSTTNLLELKIDTDYLIVESNNLSTVLKLKVLIFLHQLMEHQKR
jgi:hypothetical protein